MAIDASIISGLRPPQFESPVNALAQILQVQDAQQQNQLGQMKLDEYRRGQERTNKLQSLLGSFSADMSPDQQVGALTKGGYLPEARSLAESSAKVAKENREREKFELESHLRKFEIAGQIMNGVNDQASWERARAQTAQAFGPEAAAQLPEVYDPALIEQKRAQAMTVKDQLEQQWKQKGYDLDLKKFSETVRHNKAGEQQAERHFQIKERREANTPRGQVVQTDTGPVLVDPRTGAARPVIGLDGKPVASRKVPTEFQGKSAAFGARAEQADKILSSLQGEYSPAGINAKNAASSIWGIGGVLGTVGNNALSDASQRADQAQRDFVNAVLRQESGAAIGESEFDNAKKQYFPQPGDSAAVIKQKAANRRLAIQGLKSNAGPAAFSASGDAQALPAKQHPALPSGWSVEVN